jgi:hypothetical protein
VNHELDRFKTWLNRDQWSYRTGYKVGSVQSGPWFLGLDLKALVAPVERTGAEALVCDGLETVAISGVYCEIGCAVFVIRTGALRTMEFVDENTLERRVVHKEALKGGLYCSPGVPHGSTQNGVIPSNQFFGVLWLNHSARNGADSESFHTESADLLGLFRVKFNLRGLGLKPIRAQSAAVRVDCH